MVSKYYDDHPSLLMFHEIMYFFCLFNLVGISFASANSFVCFMRSSKRFCLKL